MAKRILAWLLCAAMLLSVIPNVPMTVEAVAPGASVYCDHTSHDGAIWQQWDETDGLPSDAGNYYLKDNVTIGVAWEVTADIHLCLNGHSITQTGSAQRVGNIRGGAELSVYDCTGKATAIITGGSGTSGAAFNVNRLGKLNLYGGTITGNGNSASGGAIYLSAANASAATGGMFNMYGGTITGNTALNGIVYVAGGADGYTNTVFNMYGGIISGNTVTGNGGAILAKAGGIVNITDGVITGNTAAAGAAVSVMDGAKLTVSGDTVIAGNTNSANTVDVVLEDKLYVNELTGGSNITMQTATDATDASQVIALDGKQTATWQAGWVTYMKADGTEQDIGYITSGSGKAFAFGHYHGDQMYTAYDGGNNHAALRMLPGYYYLTNDILRSTTSSGHASLNAGGTEQHLCLNGHSITHRNPAIRLYLIDAGDKLYIEDCTSYVDENNTFVSGGIDYAGASVVTKEEGTAFRVDAGGFLSLENVKVSGFESAIDSGSPLYVKGTAESRAELQMHNVEVSGNVSRSGGALYASTGATVTMTDCRIVNNEGTASVGAISAAGDAQVTITDCIITGNKAPAFGTVNISNRNVVLKLQGATRITGNTGGNLHIQKGDDFDANLDGLTSGASIGVTLMTDRIEAGQMYFSTVVAEGKNPLPYCYSDDDTYKVVLDAVGRLALELKATEPEPEPTEKHTHCVEGKKNCADHTCEEYEAWESGTDLPTSGNYFLTQDVVLSNRCGLNSGDQLNLCLNGFTIKAEESYEKSRAFYLRGTAKLTLTDCSEEPGKITGFKATAIICDANCTDAAINIYNIEISDNSNTGAGGAIAQQGTSTLKLTNAKVCNNSATGHAGGIYVSGSSTATITDTEITGNDANGTDNTGNGGAINLQPGSSLILDGNTKITGNSCNSLGGAIYRHVDATELKLSGDVQITGNTQNGVANNLYLAGTSKVTVENLSSNAEIGIGTGTGTLPRAISNTLSADCSGNFTSDNNAYVVEYKENALYMDAAVKHNHCICAGSEANCDHTVMKFTAWESGTDLPTSGNYFLTQDVVLSNRCGLNSGDQLNLCLNGFTIKAEESYEKSRAFYLRGTAKLTLTDCSEEPGKITGFKATAIMCDANCTDAVINLYHIAVTGNSNTGICAGVSLQGTSRLNLYSGEISNNTSADHAGGVYAGGKSTVNLIGGKITGNTAPNNGGGVYVEGKNVTINLSGTTVSGNTAKNGGGIYCQGGAHLEMTGGEISGNKATENGGGVMIYNGSSMTMTSGTVTGNTSNKYTAGVSIQREATFLLSGDARITGNQAADSFGGIYIHNLVKQANISGDVQVSGNTAKGQPSNMYLAGTATFEAGKLGEKGNVGISTGTYFRAVSAQTEEDVSAGYYSDNKTLAVIYQDKALFLGAPDGHAHCLCYGEDEHCDHTTVRFAPWESATSLPTSGYYYLTTDVVLTNRTRLDTGALNLCLNGHTIRVDENYEKGRAFYIYGDSKLTITCCADKPGTITGASETAIMFDGTCVDAELNIYNITMSGNTTTTGGGAVLVQGEATFNMYSGTLTDNTAVTVLALDADGNPKLDANGNQTIKQNMGGGAVASSGVKTTINIYGGIITNNRALRCAYRKANGTTAYSGGSGGAIYAKGNMTIYDAEITSNQAESNGGAILVGGNNTTLTIHGGKISGNTGNFGGGLISQNLTTVIMNGGQISGNTAKTAGGVYVSIRSKLTMNGGEISGNTATGDGGGMYVYASTVDLNSGAIKNNKAVGNGGGISSNKGTATINGEKVDLAPVITVNKDFAITGNYTEKNGGGIMLNGKGGQLTLDGGSISNNTAKAAAGGVLIQNSSAFTMKSGKISGNSAETGGGAYISTNTTFKMKGGSITGNSASGNTGGIHMLRSEGTFSGGAIGYNTAEGNAGGMYLSGATAKLYGTLIVGNTAVKNGGGIVTGQSSSTKNGVTTKYQCKLIMDGTVIEKNKGVNGGGLIIQSYTVLDIYSGEIRNNEATTNGGGIYASTNSTVNMTGGSLHDNYAQKSGSAVYHYNSTGNYTGIKFYNNHAENYYGAIYLNSKSVSFNGAASFTNCKFYNNQVGKDGGAFYGGQNCMVTMTECMFTENVAGEDGGAILCRGNVTMTNCLVSDNTAGVNGGGIATDKCGIRGSKIQEGLVLVNTPVTNNTAGGQGGGLYLSTGCRTTMTDVVITGNKAGAEGGGFWAVDDTTFHNITVTGNTSGGKGYAAWYDYSIYDGHSYFVGVHKISGDIIIKDNEGGDMYLGQEVAMAVGLEGLGENTKIGITLDSGILTNRLYGEYDYEGGNQVYTVTYGSRSITEPEIDTAMAENKQAEKNNTGDVLLYVGIGVFVIAIIAVAVLLITKKKKAGKTAEEVTNE